MISISATYLSARYLRYSSQLSPVHGTRTRSLIILLISRCYTHRLPSSAISPRLAAALTCYDHSKDFSCFYTENELNASYVWATTQNGRESSDLCAAWKICTKVKGFGGTATRLVSAVTELMSICCSAAPASTRDNERETITLTVHHKMTYIRLMIPRSRTACAEPAFCLVPLTPSLSGEATIYINHSVCCTVYRSTGPRHCLEVAGQAYQEGCARIVPM